MVNSNINFEEVHILSIVKLFNSKIEKFPLIFFRLPLGLLSPANVSCIDFPNAGEQSLFGGTKGVILAHVEPGLSAIAGS